MQAFLEIWNKVAPVLSGPYLTLLRIAFPLLTVLFLYRCLKPMLTFRREPEVWGWLRLTDGNALPVTHWENIIGRNKRSDIVIDFPTISRSHAVLTRYDDGSWTIRDIGSKGGILVNNVPVSLYALNEGDVISLGGVEMTLEPVTEQEASYHSKLRKKLGYLQSPGVTLMLLTLMQILVVAQMLLTTEEAYFEGILMGFGGLVALEWVLYLFFRLIHRRGFEVENLAFFLSTMGLAVIASAAPGEMVKQLIAIALGILIYLVVGWSLRNLERAQKFRYLVAAVGIGLLIVNLLFGKEIHGAKNWIVIGPMSIQPSELVKICFVYTGASALDRIVTKRNLFLFIVYSAFICLCLALMNDFGTALIFFAAFLVIAYLRSGSFATLTLACAAVAFAGLIAVRFAPHALRRFSIWGHVWEDPFNAGYSQTRAMMCMAAGGLLGLGGGNGWLRYVMAGDTDLVFGTVSEEWGLLVGMMMVISLAGLAIFVVRSASQGRSSFYTIGACAAVSILVVQTILNVLGTVDILPLTGVTFPFVSNGGSSMMSSWGLLAFVKAADTRQNASFAIRLDKSDKVDYEPEEWEEEPNE